MSNDSIREQLTEALQQSREHLRYLAELGVETAPQTSIPQLAVSTQQAPFVIGPKNLQPSSRETSAEQSISLGRSSSHPSPQTLTSSEKERHGFLFEDPDRNRESLPESNETLEEIWADIGDCTRCGLCAARTQVVNTHGNPKARLMFVGEAPGADEDAQGKPFVGRAGQLLTKIIEAIGLKREDVLIGNVNRCRPPGNRQPTLEEAAICRPFLFREIAVVKPEVIVVMGNTALRNLLDVREGITRVRGKFQDFRGIKVMPTFHPAYLLRDPSKKRETWEDLKKVRDYLDSLPPKPGC